MVNHLARAGFDVYNIDLRGRGRSAHLGAKRPLGVLDFVREDVPAALEEIEKLSGPGPVYLVGHSLGGVVSYCVAVEHRERIAGVVSLGSPYHFTLGSRWLAGVSVAFLGTRSPRPPAEPSCSLQGLRLVREGEPAADRQPALPVAGARLPPRQPRAAGARRAHVARHGPRQHHDHARHVHLGKPGAWTEDAAGGRALWLRLALRGARRAALDVAGRYDDLAAPASVKPAYDLSRSADKTYRELPFGHIDMLVGREAPQLTWPLVESWIARRLAGDKDRQPDSEEAA